MSDGRARSRSGGSLYFDDAQLLVDRFDDVGVDLVQRAACTRQERQIGQLANAPRDALRKLVQTPDRRLGEDGRLAAGLRQRGAQEGPGFLGLPGLDVDPQVGQVQQWSPKRFIRSRRPAATIVNRDSGEGSKCASLATWTRAARLA